MDDTQNQNATNDMAQAAPAPAGEQTQLDPTAATAMPSMNDLASGMTPPPPPAPTITDDQTQLQPAPAIDTAMNMTPGSGMDAAPKAADAAEGDYSYAEDILNEILDSLDRIEAKLEVMEKKIGQ